MKRNVILLLLLILSVLSLMFGVAMTFTETNLEDPKNYYEPKNEIFDTINFKNNITGTLLPTDDGLSLFFNNSDKPKTAVFENNSSVLRSACVIDAEIVATVTGTSTPFNFALRRLDAGVFMTSVLAPQTLTLPKINAETANETQTINTADILEVFTPAEYSSFAGFSYLYFAGIGFMGRLAVTHDATAMSIDQDRSYIISATLLTPWLPYDPANLRVSSNDYADEWRYLTFTNALVSFACDGTATTAPTAVPLGLDTLDFDVVNNFLFVASNAGKVSRIDLSDVSAQKVYSGIGHRLSAYGADSVLVMDTQNKALFTLKAHATNPTLDFVDGSGLSTHGTDADRLNSPSDIAVSKDGRYAFVADTGNSRIVRYDYYAQYNTTKTTFPLSVAPERIAVSEDGENLFISAGTNIYYRRDEDTNLKPISYTNPAGHKITDILCHGDMLYVITNNTTNGECRATVIKKSADGDWAGASFPYYPKITNVTSAALSQSGDKIYLLGGTRVGIFETENFTALDTITLDNECTGIATDFKGNIFTLSKTITPQINKLPRLERGYGASETYSLNFESPPPAELDALAIGENGAVYAVTKKNHLMYYANSVDSTELGIATKSNEWTPALSELETPKAYMVSVTQTAVYYSLRNFEVIKTLKSGDLFLALSKRDEMFFGITADGFSGVVNASDLSPAVNGTKLYPEKESEIVYVVTSSALVYDLPYQMSENRGELNADPYRRTSVNGAPFTLSQGTKVRILNNIAQTNDSLMWQNDANKWVYAEFTVFDKNGQEIQTTGYFKASDLGTAPELADKTKKPLGAGVIIGIVAGCIAVSSLVGVAVFFIVRRKKRFG